MTHWVIDDDQQVEILDFVDDYSRVVAAVVVPVATAADVVRPSTRASTAFPPRC